MITAAHSRIHRKSRAPRFLAALALAASLPAPRQVRRRGRRTIAPARAPQRAGEAVRYAGRADGGDIAVTIMACPPAVMEQEKRFLDVLAQASGFDVARDGALVLRAVDGRTITARR